MWVPWSAEGGGGGESLLNHSKQNFSLEVSDLIAHYI
jgi:hypothetical protein